MEYTTNELIRLIEKGDMSIDKANFYLLMKLNQKLDILINDKLEE